MSKHSLHVVLTGGTRGLGAQLRTYLIEADHLVTTIQRTKPQDDNNVSYVIADLSKLEGLSSAIDQAEKIKPIDVLINCAGLGHDGLLLIQPSDKIMEMAQVNFFAPMLLMQQVTKYMIRRRSGKIINIGSISSNRALAGLTVYGALKAGLDQLTIGFAAEVADRGISANVIAPGFLETDMTNSLTEKQRKTILRRTPTHKFSTGKNIYSVVEFLLHAPSNFTGQVLTVDGGFSL